MMLSRKREQNLKAQRDNCLNSSYSFFSTYGSKVVSSSTLVVSKFQTSGQINHQMLCNAGCNVRPVLQKTEETDWQSFLLLPEKFPGYGNKHDNFFPFKTNHAKNYKKKTLVGLFSGKPL